MVINSGDREIICYRDRKSQTLFVSDIIHPNKYPGYGKLQIGIYLAMLKDAVSRTASLRNPTTAIPETWKKRYNVFTTKERNAMKSNKKTTKPVDIAAANTKQRVRVVLVIVALS